MGLVFQQKVTVKVGRFVINKFDLPLSREVLSLKNFIYEENVDDSHKTKECKKKKK